jgi:hypothetical protein
MLVKEGESLKVCYEAGPTGFGLYRSLWKARIDCIVAAPSLVPGKAGDRVKTDRRDARKLAHFLRSGDLTEVYVPDEAVEAGSIPSASSCDCWPNWGRQGTINNHRGREPQLIGRVGSPQRLMFLLGFEPFEKTGALFGSSTPDTTAWGPSPYLPEWRYVTAEATELAP